MCTWSRITQSRLAKHVFLVVLVWALLLQNPFGRAHEIIQSAPGGIDALLHDKDLQKRIVDEIEPNGQLTVMLVCCVGALGSNHIAVHHSHHYLSLNIPAQP